MNKSTSNSNALPDQVVRQHLIDPEMCTRCNTCEEHCPSGAIKHNFQNYVVDADKCNGCLDCLGGCPTGAINHWIDLPAEGPFSWKEQLDWEELPAPGIALDVPEAAAVASEAPGEEVLHQTVAPKAPHSAAEPKYNLYDAREPALATVVANVRLTADHVETDIHHIVLDFGTTSMPVLEGQTVGVLAKGLDARGRSHRMRAYSVASPRDGELPGTNRVAFTVKRVLDEWEGTPYRGVCSNYICDLKAGDEVRCIGPSGRTFLLPNHAGTRIVMICTGTGIAPMRAMIERRRRMPVQPGDAMVLFYGGRTPEEMAYHDELNTLPADLLESKFAYSRLPGSPKRYVQDAIREDAERMFSLLNDADSYFYVCGLKSMEDGLIAAFADICSRRNRPWDSVRAELERAGRFHLETY